MTQTFLTSLCTIILKVLLLQSPSQPSSRNLRLSRRIVVLCLVEICPYKASKRERLKYNS